MVESIQVVIDRGACGGSGHCARTARGVFHLDDDYRSVVDDISAASLDAVLLAARSCPTSAISVIVDGVVVV